MNLLPTPQRTALAPRWKGTWDDRLDRIERALLGTVDGHRNIVELESVARAMGLRPDTLDRLRERGLIDIPSER
jgi:hypothetical protein